MVKKVLVVSCLCFALVVGSAGAAQISVPSLKPLSSTSAWFRVGDYATVLRGIPSASPQYLAEAGSFVRGLRHQLNDTVQRRDLHRRQTARRQARALRRGLADDARDNARAQRRKATDHYRERRHEARQIPDAQRRHKKLRHARRLLTKRKLEIERSLLGNLREARREARRARAEARPRIRALRRNDHGIAKVQNRELSYQLHALRNRS